MYPLTYFLTHEFIRFRNQTEMGHTCRGTINLANAIVHTEDVCCFVVSNGGAQTFHLKASSEVQRQKWVTALELAKATAIRNFEGKPDELYELLSMSRHQVFQA